MRNRITDRKVFSRYLDHGEERRLFRCLGACSGVLARRDLAWMRLLRHSGMRIGALARYTVADARETLRTGYFHIRGAQAKGGRGYQVFATKKARRDLSALLRIRKQMGHGNGDMDAPLVMSRQGAAALSIRSFQARMRYWCAEAGLDCQASPHWFRHTFAKRIIADSTARQPERIVQLALGQRDARSTAVYTLPDREDMAQALEESA